MTVYITEQLVPYHVTGDKREEYILRVKHNMIAQLFEELLKKGSDEIEVKIKFTTKEKEWYGVIEKELVLIADVQDDSKKAD